MANTKTRTPASTGGSQNWTKTAQRRKLKIGLSLIGANGQSVRTINVPWNKVEQLGINTKPFERHVMTQQNDAAAIRRAA